ncbi:MAG: TetR/AcrR family transcriptional regulator [Bacillota bacterium]|nr:TetR/AcrR family transcriptional regulator [Bacillota bacterium]
MAYKTSKETQEKKDAKKRHIISTAIKVFAANGYHGTTVKDVVDEAEISVGTFYFYFKNKEDLFQTLYDVVTDEIYESLFNSLKKINVEIDTGFSKAIAFFLKATESHRPLAKIMLIDAVGLNPQFEAKRAEVTNKFINITAGHFKELKQNSMIKIADVEVSAMAFIGTINMILVEWLQSDNSKRLTDFAYTLIVYNLQALGIIFNEENIRKAIFETLNTDLC